MKTNLEQLKEFAKPVTMPKKTKEKWLKALRSGGYTQTKTTLYDEDTCGFCCLGVLEHVLTGGVEYSSSGLPRSLPTQDFLKDHSIDTENEEFYVMYAGELSALSELNDDGLSFKKIANIIDKQVIGV